MAEIVVSAASRTDRGKNAARRLRKSGMVPAVIYGGKGDNLAVSVDPKALQKVLRSEAGRNTILKLDIAGHGAANAILKSWQVDPVKENFLHADFFRIAMDVAIRVTVPIHAIGEARGVKVDGGILELVLRALPVECLPGDIPERIDLCVVDVSFISLSLILPAVAPLLSGGADVLLLVKPQFEAARGEVGKGGIVRDATVRERAVTRIAAAAEALGFASRGVMTSPITGADGNVEFLAGFRTKAAKLPE